MIKVNENTCIGCGACVAIAPDNFDFNESGLSSVISETITESTQEAASACPVSAILVEAANNAETENNATKEESKVIEFPNVEEPVEEAEEETQIAA